MTVLLGSPALSGVNYDDKTKVLTVTGATTQDQGTDIFMAFKEHKILTVVLSGSGGDFYQGLYIGRIFKKHNVDIVIPENHQCISACAFSAMADKNITLDGELLFHLPYLRAVLTNTSILETVQDFGNTYMDMAMYLTEMGASVHFGKVLMSQTTTCKFLTVKDGAQMTKLLSAETPYAYVWIKHFPTDNCEMMRLLQMMGVQH